MTMKEFKHLSASSLEEACTASSSENVRVIAGGTDLLGTLKDKVHTAVPELIVDLKTISGLDSIKATDKSVKIGALTSLSQIAGHETIRANYPVLAEAARSVASPQIRNMGTLGGNLCQETRCWYYRAPDDQFHCLRKGGTKCGALVGDNRYHSIFGGARVASPACTSACPGHVKIAAYLSQVQSGDLMKAAKILLQNNPIPAMTGRVCPHTCESACNRGGFDESVSIRNIERFVGDYILDHSSELMKPPKSQTRKSVAIIGSGPAGLSAAYYLRLAGHQVTVFDRMAHAGGMLAYTIPSYRLPKDIVQKQVSVLAEMGIRFKLETEIDKKDFKALRKKFDCLFLATGAWHQKTLPIHQSELLSSGMEFLAKIQIMGPAKLRTDKVLVIGGGNVAMDVAISAKRLGIKHVTIACLESRQEMAAFPEEIAQAVEEGVQIQCSWGPKQILQRDGKVTGMEFVRCTSVFDVNGTFRPTFDSDQRSKLDADQIILAIGQGTELEYLDKSVRTERGLILADRETGATSVDGIFAAGDAVSGPATVVEAIATGRKAALAMDAYLRQKQKKEDEKTHATVTDLLVMEASSQNHSNRSEAAEVTLSERKIDREDRSTLNAATIKDEASRCLNCSCVAVSPSDIAPALIALGAKIRTTKRVLAAEDFFGAVPLGSTVLEVGELIREVEIPSPESMARQAYYKFRIRNAIDFPIVSLAAVFGLRRDGKFGRVRLALGAVAPVPLRLETVEDFLEGKTPSEDVAAAAAEIAVQESQPLSKNSFKVQIVRALVTKAVLGEHR